MEKKIDYFTALFIDKMKKKSKNKLDNRTSVSV